MLVPIGRCEKRPQTGQGAHTDMTHLWKCTMGTITSDPDHGVTKELGLVWFYSWQLGVKYHSIPSDFWRCPESGFIWWKMEALLTFRQTAIMILLIGVSVSVKMLMWKIFQTPTAFGYVEYKIIFLMACKCILVLPWSNKFEFSPTVLTFRSKVNPSAKQHEEYMKCSLIEQMRTAKIKPHSD